MYYIISFNENQKNNKVPDRFKLWDLNILLDTAKMHLKYNKYFSYLLDISDINIYKSRTVCFFTEIEALEFLKVLNYMKSDVAPFKSVKYSILQEY